MAKRPNREETIKRAPDFGILLSVVVLLGIGTIMVFSSSQYFAQYYPYYDSFYFLKRQLVNVAVGICGMIFFMKVKYTYWKKFSLPALIFCVVLLLLIFLSGLGVEGGGAARWLNIGGFQFQPSEVAKVCMILYMATYLTRNQFNIQKSFRSFAIAVAIFGTVAMLVVVQPGLSTGIVIAATCYVMMICIGCKPAHLLSLMGLGVAAVIAAIILEPFRMRRIVAFMNPWADAQDSGFQTVQSLLAIGSGGFSGAGLGAGGAKWYYLPAQHTDFIFSVLAEELGFIGAALVVALFLFFIWRGFLVSIRCPDVFGSLLAVGITSMIGIQAMINLMVATGLFPVTGVTLPFISYGGTSLVISLASVGLLLSVSCYTKLD